MDSIDAYAAGLFDGEGCVEFNYCSAFISITNTNKEALDFILKHFGGRIVNRPPRGRAQSYAWRWAVYGAQADNFVERILPYSIIKSEQLEVFMQLRKTFTDKGRNQVVSPEIRTARSALFNELKLLRLLPQAN